MKSVIAQPSLLALAIALAAGGAQAGECTQRADTAVMPLAAVSAPVQVIYYNPWGDFLRIQALMDRQINALNALWQPMNLDPQAIGLVPLSAMPIGALPLRVSTLQPTADGYRLQLPLPGYKADDIHVRIDGQLLSISAATENTVKVGRQDEQSRSSFAETLTLPGPVQASEVKQTFENGVLTLTIPSQKSAAGKV